MGNAWTATESPRAVWLADLHPLADRPEDLLAIVVEILRAGEQHQVLQFYEVPALGWKRDRDPPLAEVVAADYRNVGGMGQRHLDAFGFTRATWSGRPGDAVVGARLAVFDRHDQVVEQDVTDLAAAATLDPATAVDVRASRPPLTICGHRLALIGDPPRLLRTHRWPGMVLRFMLFGDIWWPSLRRPAGAAPADNRALASRHTPRLDRFLARAKAAVVDRGGRWMVDPPHAVTRDLNSDTRIAAEYS